MRAGHIFFTGMILLALASPALSQEKTFEAHGADDQNDTMDVIIPANNPVGTPSPVLNESGEMVFKGKFKLSGTWYYGGQADLADDDTTDDTASLYFKPDKAALATLPHAAEENYSKPEEIEFDNPAAFEKAVMPDDEIQAIRAGTVPSAHGHVTLIGNKFAISPICENVIYLMHFIALDQPQLAQLRKGDVDTIGCL